MEHSDNLEMQHKSGVDLMSHASHKQVNWAVYATLSFTAMVVVTVVAAWSRLWVLTALPVGFLFGFFIQKGDLCGTSAFSEIIMMKDSRKVFGLWVLIVVAMAAFALLDLLGWVKLNPKPLLYLNYLVGGIIFGVGTVLAGGCISGCMYKAATGNLNSIVALVAIGLGVMVVEHGPLNALHHRMEQFVIKSGDGSAVSLPSLLNLPYWFLAVAFGVLTIVGVRLRSRIRSKPPFAPTGEPWLKRGMTRPWKPWAAGIAIGLLMIPAYLSSVACGRNYPLGVTHGVMQVELLLIDRGIEHVWKPKPTTPKITAPATTTQTEHNPESPAKRPSKKVVWWLVALVLGSMLGSWVSGRMSGQAKLLPKPPDEILFALLGGLLVGIGAAFATGCVVGNIMSGWALMSVGMFLFGIVTVLSNWVTTYFYMMGGQSAR